MARRQLVNVAENRPRRQRRPEREDLIQRDEVDAGLDVRVRQQRLDLGAEDQLALGDGVEERPDAEAIARGEEHAASRVPDGKRPLAVQPLDAVLALFFVEMEDHFRVGPRREDVAGVDELLAQLDVIEDLAVERDPEAPILVAHRLLPAGEIEDAEPRVREAQRAVREHGFGVRPAMPE